MSYDPNNENFVNLAEVVRRCSKKNFGCDECPDEVACKKWWDEVGIEVNTEEAAKLALEQAPFLSR